MCLYIKKIPHSYKTETINNQKMIPVWKIITTNNKSPSKDLRFNTGATEHSWTKGWNISNRRFRRYNKFDEDRPNTFDEDGPKTICKGFHCLTRKKDAIAYRQAIITYFLTRSNRKLNQQLKIIKVYVRKDDIIAKGHSCFGTFIELCPSLAATQVYWKGI